MQKSLENLTPSQLAEIRRPLSSVVRVFGNWILIAFCFYILLQPVSILLKMVCFFVIGVEQHALSMWLHEGAHWLLFKNKKVNDLFCSIFLASPLYVSFSVYRKRHFTHHRYLGTPQDTKEVIFTNIAKFNFLKFTLASLSGLRFFQMTRSYLASEEQKAESSDKKTHFLILGFIHAFAIGMTFVFKQWSFYFLYWLLPFMTVFQWVAGLRALIEHYPPTKETAHPYTAQISATFVERFLFARAGFDHHWFHHKQQWIPHFMLSQLRENEIRSEIENETYFHRLKRIIKGTPNV